MLPKLSSETEPAPLLPLERLPLQEWLLRRPRRASILPYRNGEEKVSSSPARASKQRTSEPLLEALIAATPSSESIIPVADGMDLRWFLASGGLGVFAKSTCGSMLMTAEFYAYETRECRACMGSGWVASQKAKRDPRPGELSAMAMELLFGSGPTSPEVLQWVAEHKELKLPPRCDRVCPRCEGRGFRAQRVSQHRAATTPTVRQTGNSKPLGPAYPDIDEAGMEKRGKVVSRLATYDKLDHNCGVALLEYYAPNSECLESLWHLVPIGRAMLKKNDMRLPPYQFWRNERERLMLGPNPQMQAKFREADAQAQALLERCGKLWNLMLAAQALVTPRWFIKVIDTVQPEARNELG